MGLKTNIYNDVYSTLYNANLGSSTLTVTSAFITSNPTYPQLVIYPVDSSEDEFTLDTNRTSSTRNITLVLDLFTKSTRQIDNIVDEVEDLLRGVSLVSGTVNFESLNGASGVAGEYLGQKVYPYTITLTFTYRG